MPVSDLDIIGFRVCCCGRVFWGRTTLERRGCAVIMTPLEIKGAVAGVITLVLVLVKRGWRADPGALGERESLACQIGPKFKLRTRPVSEREERPPWGSTGRKSFLLDLD
jgi:hypothetical protein